jgi:hypothetical protein
MHAVVVYHTNSNNEHIQSHYSKITITFQAQHDTKQHAAAMTTITWNTLVQTIQRRLYCTSDPTTTAVNTSKMAKNSRKTATRLLQNDDETDESLYTEMLEMETTMTDGSTTEDGSSALFSSWTQSTLLYHDNDNDDDDTATTSLFARTPRERYRHRCLLQRQPKQQPLTAIATVPSLCFSPTAKISNLSQKKQHPTFFTKRLPSENDDDNHDNDNDNESMDSSSTTITEHVVVFEYPSDDDGSDSDSDSSSSASDSSSANNNNNDACSFTHSSSSTTTRHSHTTTTSTTTTTASSTGDDDIPSLLLQRPYSLKRPAQSMHTRQVMADSNHHHHNNNNKNRSRRKRRSLRLQIL